MKASGGCWAVVAVLLLFPVLGRAAEGVLSVTGEVKTPLKLSLTDLKAMPTAKVTVKDPDGSTATYDGVALCEILKRAGVPQRESLHKDALQLCVLVKAADGYKVVFSLAELDPSFSDRQVLLAFRRNGAELDAKTGPFRVVVPGEKKHGRWIRQVTESEVVRVNGGAK
jgi:DMSO/TMAO reductase YedYZ molybdopterin-dependent catalytic subunit